MRLPCRGRATLDSVSGLTGRGTRPDIDEVGRRAAAFRKTFTNSRSPCGRLRPAAGDGSCSLTRQVARLSRTSPGRREHASFFQTRETPCIRENDRAARWRTAKSCDSRAASRSGKWARRSLWPRVRPRVVARRRADSRRHELCFNGTQRPENLCQRAHNSPASPLASIGGRWLISSWRRSARRKRG